MTVTPKFRLALPTYNVPGWDDDVNGNFSVIDAVLGQYTALLNVVGIWTNSTAYTTPQQVIDTVDSTIWECNVNHTSVSSGVMSVDRAAHPTYWTNVSGLAASAAASAAAAAASSSAAGTYASAAASSSTGAAGSANSATASQLAAAASAVAAAAAAAGVAAVGTTRNAVVNGGFDIWQRGSPIVVPVSTNTWTADRWRAFHDGAGGTTTITFQATGASIGYDLLHDAGLRNVGLYTVTGAAAGQTVRQFITPIEDVHTFSGRTVTLSFYANAVTGGPFNITAFLSQNFGTGGSPSATVNSAAHAFAITGTVTKFSFSWVLPSVKFKTVGSNLNDHLDIVFGLPLTGTYSMGISGVQLELGSTASDWSYRPIQQEQALCERYCQTGQIAGSFSSTIAHAIVVSNNLRTKMRGVPTVNTVVSTANTNVTGGTLSSTAELASYSGTATATAASTVNMNYRLEAEMP